MKDSQFSQREKEVIGLLIQGKSNKQIALTLHIAESTVEYHLKNIYQKLNVRSRTEAVLQLGKSIGADSPGELRESIVEMDRRDVDNDDKSILLRRFPMNQKRLVIVGLLVSTFSLVVVSTVAVLILRKMPAQDTAITPTSVLMPTAAPATATQTETPTPTHTSTPTIEPTPTFLYDTFENPAHDGYINEALWDVHTNNNIGINQHDGTLVFQASRPNNPGALWINPTSGVEVSLQNYNFIEANFSWGPNIENRVFFGITVLQNWSPRVAYSCDFILTEASTVLHCSGIDGQQMVSPKDISVVTGQAYELRFEIDPTTAAFVIYLDDTVIDTYNPPFPEKWLQGQMSYDIHFGADPGSIATGYVDDVRFGGLK